MLKFLILGCAAVIAYRQTHRWLCDKPFCVVRPGAVVFLLGGIAALSASLRLLFLSDKSLWVDEAFSAWTARLEGASFVSVLTEEVNMAFYYLLLRFWLALGESEFVLRSLSVVAAVATVPVVYELGKRLFGARVGLLGALLLALNAFDIEYAQEARGYSLVMFLATTSSLFFIRSIEQPTRIHWAGYILAGVLGVYTHFVAALVLVAHYSSVVFLSRRAIPWNGLAWSASIIGFLILPLIVFVVAGDAQQISWIPEPGLLSVIGVFSALAGAGGPPLLLAYFACCLIALFEAGKAWFSTERGSRRWHYCFLLMWLCLPIVLALLVSFVTPVFSRRYFLVCLPSMALLAAAGICALRRSWMLAGMIVLIVSLATRAIVEHYNAPKEDWRAATHYVVSVARSGDAALFYLPLGRIPFDYYQNRLHGLPERPAIVFPSRRNYSLFFREARSVTPDEALLDKLPNNYSRVWLILGAKWEHSALGRATQASLASGYHLINRRRFTDITVVLYANAPRKSHRDTIETMELPRHLRANPLRVALPYLTSR